MRGSIFFLHMVTISLTIIYQNFRNNIIVTFNNVGIIVYHGSCTAQDTNPCIEMINKFHGIIIRVCSVCENVSLYLTLNSLNLNEKFQ